MPDNGPNHGKTTNGDWELQWSYHRRTQWGGNLNKVQLYRDGKAVLSMLYDITENIVRQENADSYSVSRHKDAILWINVWNEDPCPAPLMMELYLRLFEGRYTEEEEE